MTSTIDRLSLIGISLALIAIVGGQLLEGGNLSSLIQPTAFLIVLGGTVGAVMLQSPWAVFMRGLRMLRWIVQPPARDPQRLITQITLWSNNARKGGLLALESFIEREPDPLIRKALQLLVDGTEPEHLRRNLMLDVDAEEDHLLACAKIWEAAGGYAPTVGILGAVLGLIHVMENLSDPSKLGSGIAVAFVATVYGVGSANLIFLPTANKLKHIIQEQVTLKHMLVDGFIGIAHGENPRLIESRLQAYFHRT